MAMTATERSRNRRVREKARREAKTPAEYAAVGAFEFNTPAADKRPVRRAKGKVADLITLMKAKPGAEPPPVRTLTVPRALNLEDFSIGPTGMRVKGSPTFDSWAGVGELLRTFEHGLQWSVGDWLNFGEDTFGEKSAQVIDATEWSEESVRVYRWVAKSVPLDSRVSGLSFQHHMTVASMPPAKQLPWLQKALAGDGEGDPWTVSRLRKELKSISGTTETGWYLLVTCASATKMAELDKRLRLEGLETKVRVRRE